MRGRRIWALLGAHAGDNNQVLALAEALGRPFQIKALRYNHWRHLQPRLLSASLRSLDRRCLGTVSGEAPDLTISTGHRSVPIVQHLRARSRGRMRSVHIGYPRISPDRFDLVVATPEYPLPDAPNVMRIPFALTRSRDAHPFEEAPAPRRLIILGGPTLYWRLTSQTVLGAIGRLTEAAANEGGSVTIVVSPRTPGALFRHLRDSNIPASIVAAGGPPSYDSLLAGADQLFVSADSVAMVSDAIATDKPVGIIPIEPTLAGRAYMAMLGSGTRMRPRDLRFFWRGLTDQKLVGTIEEPRAAHAPDLNGTVAARVMELLRAE